MILLSANSFGAGPADVRFEIAFPEGRSVYRQGEIIPIKLRLSTPSPNRWMAQSRMYDRSGRLEYVEEFRIEPAAAVRDPLEGLLSGIGGGLSGGPAILTAEPFEYTRDLNEWVQFERPGTYRLVVLTRRVSRIPDGADLEKRIFFAPSSEALELTSNSLTFQIVEPSPEWQSGRIRQAVELLSTPASDPNAHDILSEGGRILRFLGSPEAAFEMARRFSDGPQMPVVHFRFGLLTSPHAEAVVAFMEKRLSAPDQAVTDTYVDTLARLAINLREGATPPFPEAEAERQRWQDEQAQRRRRLEALKAEYFASLAAALPTKRPPERSVCATALSSFAAWQESPPPWRQAITNYLRGRFTDLPPLTQYQMLSHRWPEIAGPEMIPVLLETYRRPPDTGNRDIENLALRRLYELDPGAGRRLVVEEILNPVRGLEWTTLAMLDEDSLPEAFETFRADLIQGGANVDRLVLRYGDQTLVEPAIEALRIRETSSLPLAPAKCPSSLHLFLLKQEAESSEAEFQRAIAGSIASNPLCLRLHNLVPGPYAWSPQLEDQLAGLLHGVPNIAKESAAELLSRYGSAAAEEPLWNAFEAFHQWWKGRQEDLAGPQGEESVRLERALRKALAQGSAWILDETKMAKLKELCVSEECRNEVASWITSSAEPLYVSLSYSGPEHFSASVGRFNLRSKAELLAKLRQFPAGAQISWSHRPGPSAPADSLQLVSEIERILPGLQ